MGGLFSPKNIVSRVNPQIFGLQMQTSAYGRVLSLIYGRNRSSGNLIWYSDFKAIPHNSNQSSGGKGGGGSMTNTTFTYQAAVMFAICEGPIRTIGDVWSGKSKEPTLSRLGLSLFTGAYPQAAWGYLTTNHPDQAIGYEGVAYAAAGSLQLDSSASIANLSYEIYGLLPYSAGTIDDANPRDILNDYLTDANHGVGFPSAKIGDLTQLSNYCIANGLFLSPSWTSQSQANQHIDELMQATNSACYFSEGLLKVAPYGDQTVTGNGVTFTPNVTPVYDLTDDDFKYEQGHDPVVVTRKAPADCYNSVKVEYADRSNDYNVAVAEAQDLANIEVYGPRPMSPVQLHSICNQDTAQLVANLILQRALYIRNTYEFYVSWKYCLLEPMDIVTLTDANLGLNKTPVRIVEVQEDKDGLLYFKAEEFPVGTATAALYPSQSGSGTALNYNIAPGNANVPVIFEPPDALTTAGLEVWIGASGSGSNWGGCDVWVSFDNTTYQRVGTIHGSARQGVLSAVLPSGSDPDTTDTLSVDLTMSGGTLASGTQNDADNLRTLCYVDGELVAYETATLTATSKYNLTYLRRGAYGTAIASHAVNSPFLRVDQAIAKYAFQESQIGSTIYVKLASFNVYGGGAQALSDVSPTQYRIAGSSLYSPLPNVQNLRTVYQGVNMQLAWDAVTDFRSPIDYEVRKGAAWGTAEVLGRTPTTGFTPLGDGTYWVAAHYGTAYSASPSEILIAGAALTKNVLVTHDEFADGWPGALSGGAAVDSYGDLVLDGSGLFSSIPDVAAVGSFLYYGGISASGTYTIPAGRIVDVGTAQACNLSVIYQIESTSPYNQFSQIPDVASVASVVGNFAGKSDVRVQVNISQDGVSWAGWQDFVPGTYVGRKFNFRLYLESFDTTAAVSVLGFKWTVDMPDRVDSGTDVAVDAAGTTIAYKTAFHGGSNDALVPGPNITVLNAQPGDTVVLSNQTLTGFTVQIMNGGVGVARSINWIAQGY